MSQPPDPAKLKAAVIEALNNAVTNGYDHVKTDDPELIAIDVLDYDSTVADLAWNDEVDSAIELVKPHVVEWQNEQKSLSSPQ